MLLQNGDFDVCEEVAASHVMSLPRLKSLHMKHITTEDLLLLCPGLRSLNIYDCPIKENLFLPASLEEFSIEIKTGYCAREASAVCNVLALTSLTSLVCNVLGGIKQDLLYDVLPAMSVLRKLDLTLSVGGLPPQLPASLQVIK